MSLMDYLRHGQVRFYVYFISFERGMNQAEVYSCAIREREERVWMTRGGNRVLEVRRETGGVKISLRNLDLSDEFGEQIHVTATYRPVISRSGKYAILLSNTPWSRASVISLARTVRDCEGYGRYIDEF